MRPATAREDSSLLLDDPVTAVGAVTNQLADEAAESRQRRHLTDGAVETLHDRGLLQLAWPTGRYATHTIHAQTEVLTALAQIDGSLAWVAAHYSAAPYLIAALGDHAFSEFVGSQTAVATLVLDPAGTASRTTGGWSISGWWSRCVGQHHAGWILVPAQQTAGPPILALIPREQFDTVHDGDDTALHATGAHTVTTREVFVPDHRAASLLGLLDGTTAAEGSLAGREYYAGPLVPRLCALLAAVPIGITRAMLGELEDHIHYRDSQTPLAGSPLTQRRIHDAATALFHAEAHLARLAGTVDAHVHTGHEWALHERAQCRADLGETVRLCRHAGERIATAAGIDVLSARNPLSDQLADLRALSAEPLLAHDDAVTAHGEILCRQPPTRTAAFQF